MFLLTVVTIIEMLENLSIEQNRLQRCHLTEMIKKKRILKFELGIIIGRGKFIVIEAFAGKINKLKLR